MISLHYFQQGLVNLLAAKLRSFLAVLGILVGTAAVVALISSGQLATQKALAEFKSLGTELLAVSIYPKAADKSTRDSIQFSLNDWRGIHQKISTIEGIAPYSILFQPISFEGREIQGPIIGADESLASIIGIHLKEGHFVSFVNSFEHFCVIGDQIAKQLERIHFGSLIGKQLRIGKTLYTVVGVIKPWQENGFFNEDINQAVIVPIAGISLISSENKIHNAIIKLKLNSPIDEVIDQIKLIITTKAPNMAVFLRSAKQIISSMESQGRIFTLLLAVIGGVSLLVGGIGVMNVMLVCVSERKKEIGIRKAVGAKNREIQLLFLVESIMLSCFGGVLGVFLGLFLTRIIAYFSHWQFAIFWEPVFVGFVVSVASGIFFGFYPAKRAAKMEPMVSLRSD